MCVWQQIATMPFSESSRSGASGLRNHGGRQELGLQVRRCEAVRSAVGSFEFSRTNDPKNLW